MHLSSFAFLMALFLWGSPGDEKTAPDARSAPLPADLCDHRTPVFIHVVAEGEHLGLIAGRYGILRKDLLRTNPDLAENPDHLRVGRSLQVCPEIPPREFVESTHVVSPGESLSLIAERYGLTLGELVALQGETIRDPNAVRAGQSLRIVTQGEIVRGFEPDPPKPGRLRASRKLDPAEHFMVKRPDLAWGTPHTITTIEQALARYRARADGGPTIHVGDISRQGGGPLRGHHSHQRGVDVDIGLVLRGDDAQATRFLRADRTNLDVHRTWLLVKSFLETERVRYIFLDYQLQELLCEHARSQGVPEAQLDEWFQYPRGIGRNHGIVRHWKGHRNHIHVRFRR